MGHSMLVGRTWSWAGTIAALAAVCGFGAVAAFGAEVPWAAKGDQAVQDSLGPGTVRFFENQAALSAALPSYALVSQKGDFAAAAPTASHVLPAFGEFEGKKSVRIKIEPGTSLYGTGEVAGPLLRNGKRIVCWNTDAYGYGPEATSLYQSHPWVLAVREDGTAFGVLADTTYRCTVDTAAADPGEILFFADGPSFPVIVIERDHPQDVLMELARLTGHMPIPPKWAVGYHQCRYSYFPEARVREIAAEFRSRGIPCDVIWYDIDYYDTFRVFTFNKVYFPDPKALNADLLKDGFHNVWMINPGIKAETGPGITKIFDSGNEQDVWVKGADAKTYRGEVWPGWCVFPDYTDPRVRAWWGPFYRDFMAQGITGVWNDMNEPAIFNVKSKTMPEDNRHQGDPALLTPVGSPQSERAEGDHARYHNVYGMLMVKGTREGIAAANPEKRPFVLSRANYIGGHRYAATWTGDNSADWFHLEASIPMVLNVGLSGQPFIGPDIGGFAGNGDGKLFARWMGFGALLPFSRGHTGKENIDKEPWAFGPEVEATCREALKRRYRLMPYLYTLFQEASVNGLPVARPTFFADPKDPALRSEDDSFLLGEHLLVVAQVLPDRSRAPVMPRGTWREIEASPDPDLPRLFVRGGSILPTGPDINHTGEKPLDPLTLVVCLDKDGKAAGTLYEDAGDGFGYEKGEYLLSRYVAEKSGNTVTVSLAGSDGKMKRADRELVVRVLQDGTAARAEGRDGQAVTVTLK